jgi:hypothetical protein
MSKPDYIPQDVWEVAYDIAKDRVVRNWSVVDQAQQIANAILNERNNAAKIAEDMLRFADTTSGADKAISLAIRNGGK